MSEPKEIDLWALTDLATPWCVHVAATLRIADRIDGGIYQIHELARAAGCDAGILHAVMGRLVRHGLFEEPSQGQFTLNAAARQLLDPTLQQSLDLDGLGGRFAHAWGTLLQLTRTGEPAYAEVFGKPFWEDLNAHPKISAHFDDLIGPAGHGTPNPVFQITGGWEAVNTVIDVGGGTGAMLAEMLRLHPHLSGILVDQPGTAARSGEIFANAGVSERVTVVGQSFFDTLPAGADIYLLRGILNDWPDREALAILRRCAEAARPNGRVVVLKSVSPDGTPKDLTIEMVLLGGKHRNESEFRELARAADLEVTAAAPTPVGETTSGGYFVVECRPL
jgi:2,7-dihydroxy-5-methyl-1-naphthoate 7-O-methyltransferase